MAAAHPSLSRVPGEFRCEEEWRAGARHRRRLCGTRAGYELQQVGYAVTILEARDRVGGRVWTLKDVVPGKQVEGGGELIGSNHPMWLAYQKVFDLEFLGRQRRGKQSDDSARQSAGRKRHQRELLHQNMDDALDALTDLAATIVDPYQPWINLDAAALDAQSLEDWIAKVDTRLCARTPSVCR